MKICPACKGDGKYVEEEYPDLTSDQAGKVLIYWMRTFGERNATMEGS